MATSMSRAESVGLRKDKPDGQDLEDLKTWWDRFCKVYDHLVPIAEETDIRLAIHPSNTPLPDTGLGGLGFHRVIDAYSSCHGSYLYCCGKRVDPPSFWMRSTTRTARENFSWFI